jgi:hypothetical protein
MKIEIQVPEIDGYFFDGYRKPCYGEYRLEYHGEVHKLVYCGNENHYNRYPVYLKKEELVSLDAGYKSYPICRLLQMYPKKVLLKKQISDRCEYRIALRNNASSPMSYYYDSNNYLADVSYWDNFYILEK